jgi:tight adherence protein B
MEIIRSTVRQLSDKLEVEKEIQTMLAAKQLEFRLLTIIPLGMIGYLKLSFPGMVEILYGNILGVVVMSVCLLVYLFSYEMGKRVVEIEV